MIYLDNAATTKTAPEVLEAMLPYFGECYGNPSAVYSLGSAGKKAINQARRTIAAAIHALPEEIFFTSGGSEADNWALKAAAESLAHKGKHIITTKIEHHAVLHTCAYLEKCGFEVTYLPVDGDGMVQLDELAAAVRPDTILISVMFANNEVGTIEPIREIGALARERGILFHTDAVQAFGQLDMDVEELKIDLMSASAHKLYGPKGAGFLYVRSGSKLPAFLHGGAQERGYRAGTENVPAIVGFGAAAARAYCMGNDAEKQVEELPDDSKKRSVPCTLQERTTRVEQLRDYLIERLEREIPGCRLNGHRTRRLPGNVNVCIEGVVGETVVIMLDRAGVCASSGSACTSGSLDPSHVLLAMGRSKEQADGSLRMTLSEENTREELDFVVEQLKGITEKLRKL